MAAMGSGGGGGTGLAASGAGACWLQPGIVARQTKITKRDRIASQQFTFLNGACKREHHRGYASQTRATPSTDAASPTSLQTRLHAPQTSGATSHNVRLAIDFAGEHLRRFGVAGKLRPRVNRELPSDAIADVGQVA
jgi:hypothetical protein